MKRLHRIFDALDRVLLVAEKHQEATDKSISDVDRATRNLERSAQSLKAQIQQEIEVAFEESVEKVTSNLTQKFEVADKYADKAANRYEKAAKWAIWKVVMTGLIILIMATLLLIQFIPSFSEIEALRLERQSLELAIDKLVRKGALAQASTCGELRRLCVKIDVEEPIYENDYRIIANTKP